MSESDETDTATDPGRRKFLRLSALPVLLPALATAIAAPSKSARAELSPALDARSFCVGYWAAGSVEALGGMLQLAPANAAPFDAATAVTPVIGAESIADSDPALADHPVHLQIYGLQVSDGPGGFEYLALDVMHRVGDIDATLKVPFHAWSYSSGPPVVASSPIAFTVLAEPQTGIELCISSRCAFSHTIAEEPLSLVLDPTKAAPKLSEGVYFIAGRSRSSGWLPDWDMERYAFRQVTEDGARRLFREEVLGWSPVDFDYLVLSVRADE